MIEYLLDAIRATAGEDINIQADITLDYEPVTSGCGLRLFIDDDVVDVAGAYENGVWVFTIPAEATANLKGRYFYSLYCEGSSVTFKEAIYLM